MLLADKNEDRKILPHYDEWAVQNKTDKRSADYNVKHSFSLNQLSQLPENKRDNIPEPLTLTSKTHIQSDYFTPEEMQQKFSVQFKAPKKIKRIKPRKKEQTDETETVLSDILVKPKKAVAMEPEMTKEENDDELLYEQLAKRRNVSIKLKPESKTDPCVKTIKEMISVVDAFEDNSNAAAIAIATGYHSVGLIDIKPEEIAPNFPSTLELSGTTEFCRVVQTPSEKLEEHNMKSVQTLSYLKARRGLSVHKKSENKNNDGSDALNDDNMTSNSPNGKDTAESDDEQLTEEDNEIIKQILSDEVLDGGVTSALKYLKSRGILHDEALPRRWKNSKEHQPLHMSLKKDDIKIEYRDDYGKVMNPKEAFRYISWVFHGKGPGKRKREKILRKMELEKKIRMIGANQNELPTMMALQKKEQPYLILNSTPNSTT